MIRVGCETCKLLFAMPIGASVGEMSAWMRWHACDNNEQHTLIVHAPGDVPDARPIDVTHEQLREAMQRSRDYDEGQRDAAQYVVGCIDHVGALEPDGVYRPTSARQRGADALLSGVRFYVAQQVARMGRAAVGREVSPDAETVREQADALDVGKPDAGEDDTAPIDVRDPLDPRPKMCAMHQCPVDYCVGSPDHDDDGGDDDGAR